MTKLPVKFREHVKITEMTKDFIRKCLAVEERDRMSLDDLRHWLTTKSLCNT
jgi:hypothetical protein